ncbi:MAG: hypothetical protein GY705_31790 [Bacteroidetes bacterium]|nr:hypothetical protein [Bacteroidota bacterium]
MKIRQNANFIFFSFLVSANLFACTPLKFTPYVLKPRESRYNQTLQSIPSENPYLVENKSGRRWFLLGKTHYNNCHFTSAIDSFIRAVETESNPAEKAHYQIYMGASFFYLGNVTAARNSFKIAKQISPFTTPSPEEFAFEILSQFNSI